VLRLEFRRAGYSGSRPTPSLTLARNSGLCGRFLRVWLSLLMSGARTFLRVYARSVGRLARSGALVRGPGPGRRDTLSRPGARSASAVWRLTRAARTAGCCRREKVGLIRRDQVTFSRLAAFPNLECTEPFKRKGEPFVCEGVDTCHVRNENLPKYKEGLMQQSNNKAIAIVIRNRRPE
jgi:hypothetical protein